MQSLVVQVMEIYSILLTVLFFPLLIGLILYLIPEVRKNNKEFYEKNRTFVHYNHYNSMITFNSNPPFFLRRKAKICKGYAELKVSDKEQKELSQCNKWKCSPNNCPRSKRKNCFRERHVRHILQT